MKNLYQSNRDLDRVNARFVWVSGGPEDMEGESRLLPSNPLKFGYSDIASFKRELRERPSKKLTGTEKRDFGAMVNHQLKKVETETEDSATSRTLFAILYDFILTFISQFCHHTPFSIIRPHCSGLSSGR